MADDTDNPGGPAPDPASQRRTRRARTIDLSATEIPVERQEPAPASPDATDDTVAASGPEPLHQEMPPSVPPPDEAAAAAGPGPASGIATRWLLQAGVAGVTAGALLIAALWFTGMFTRRDTVTSNVDSRLASLETRLRETPRADAPAPSDAKIIEELSARLAKIESGAGTPAASAGDTSLASRLTALEESVKAVQSSGSEANRRADDVAAAVREARGRADAAFLAADAARTAAERADVASLVERVAALERSAKTVADDVAKKIATTGDRPLRLVVAAQALRSAVERGDPYAAELAAVTPLSGDPPSIGALEPFAKSGLPHGTTLAQEFSDVAPAMLRATGKTQADEGFLDRLQTNAQRLVRVRPIDEKSGDEPAAVVSRIQIRASRGDFAGILAEWEKLPEAARAPAQEWIKKVQARVAAVNASRKLASDALANIAKTSP